MGRCLLEPFCVARAGVDVSEEHGIHLEEKIISQTYTFIFSHDQFVHVIRHTGPHFCMPCTLLLTMYAIRSLLFGVSSLQ